MTKRLTDAERAAALRAKADRIEAREAERRARAASKDVRAWEMRLKAFERAAFKVDPAMQVADLRTWICRQLTAARAAALTKEQK